MQLILIKSWIIKLLKTLVLVLVHWKSINEMYIASHLCQYTDHKFRQKTEYSPVLIFSFRCVKEVMNFNTSVSIH